MILPGLIALANIIILTRISVHHSVVTNRERGYQNPFYASWQCSFVIIILLSWPYILPIFISSTVWIFLISCLYMVPQILHKKYQEQLRSNIYWLFNISFGLSQFAFLVLKIMILLLSNYVCRLTIT